MGLHTHPNHPTPPTMKLNFRHKEPQINLRCCLNNNINIMDNNNNKNNNNNNKNNNSNKYISAITDLILTKLDKNNSTFNN